MELLLDTNTFLWWLDSPERLGIQAHEAISERSNEVFLSMASIWELSIKTSLGKLRLGKPLTHIVEACGKQGIYLFHTGAFHFSCIGERLQ